MSKQYRSREGDLATVDTKTQLTTLASESAPGPLLVPSSMKNLRGMFVVASSNLAVATDGTFLVRLEGPGLKDGPQVVVGGAAGVAVATGGHGSIPAVFIPLDLEVSPNEEILLFAENTGEDVGAATVGVTLQFDTDGPKSGFTKRILTVTADVNAIDTIVEATGQGSVAAPSRLTDPLATEIHMIVAASSNDGLAAGQAAMFMRLSGPAIQNGSQTLMFSGHSSIAVQSGADAAPSLQPPILLMDLGIAVFGSETVTIQVEHAGVDVGDTANVISIFMR